jgi:hypothetical protein
MQQRLVRDPVNGIGIDANQTHEDSAVGRAKWLILGN